MLRYFAALLCLLSTFSQAQTISVITPPALPSGVWSQGGAYTTTVTLKNSGPSYLASEVADVGAANIAAVAEGRVVPYVYRFELVNLSTGSEDGALFTYGSTNVTPILATTSSLPVPITVGRSPFTGETARIPLVEPIPTRIDSVSTTAGVVSRKTIRSYTPRASFTNFR